jgi:chemotaxis protein methyltransferase CheR
LPSRAPAETATGRATLTDREFGLFRAMVAEQTGMALGPHRRVLLQVRLGGRLRALRLGTFSEYYRLLTERDPLGEEMIRLINAITTNRTEFLRERHHFDYLSQTWVPTLRARIAETGDRSVRIWSAGCSSGEEPYTIAMTLRDVVPALSDLDISILASDIDTDVLTRAAEGIYSLEAIGRLPKRDVPRHFLRGIGAQSGFVQVRPEIRAMLTVRRINLLEYPWPIRTRFDVVFCRNVLIYFGRATQVRVLDRLVDSLKDDGLLILGHAESIHGIGRLRHLGRTIYQRTKEKTR